ncbi:MAG: hypothetical protein DRI95_03555 [Bacteroidetes bacterium]|nr:MAG: hypothetical protein DRI95_03555 [Bacteroidota bacterium]
MTNKSKLLFFSIIFLSVSTFAQDWHWEVELNDITNDGFFKINISPEIVSASENNTGDIRIYDALGNEIPFILEKEQSVNLKEFFVKYKIITNEIQRKWPYYSRIVIHNPKKNEISNLQLIIRNADVSKTLKLSGSDDAVQWYVVKDKYRFRSIYNDEATAVIQILNFPNSNYEYYEILIDDWRNNPIKIEKAGYFDSAREEGKYAKIINPTIEQKELKEEKQSLVYVQFPTKQLVNKIHLKIDGSEFYHRDAEILVKDSTIYKKKKPEYFFRSLHSFIISSNSLNNIYFTGFDTKEFFIRVNNYDDKPIKISAVNSWQLKHYLISKLRKAKNYYVRTGNVEISEPEYDLKYFKNEIPEKLSFISTKKIADISKKEQLKPKGLQVSKIVIWLVIGGIALLLIYFISKMMKDMNPGKRE